MSYGVDETHDPQLTSWIAAANDPQTDFPIQHLPFGVFTTPALGTGAHIGVGIGDQMLDLTACAACGLLDSLSLHGAQEAWRSGSLNWLMQQSPEDRRRLRQRLSELLRSDNTEIQGHQQLREEVLVPLRDVKLVLPVNIGDYTDFYSSIFHATNVGKMMRPDNPLLPNYKYVPIAYHGRASSVVVSGTPIRRPNGQTRKAAESGPEFGPSRSLDYELEVGFFVGRGNELGQPININDAEHHIFGLCLVNDWSARDVQAWEYQPLGPFLAKNFATSVSPWIVTIEALAPFRVPAFKRPTGDPAPLAYLSSQENQEHGGVDIKLEVLLSSQKMREQNIAPVRLSHSNFRDMYWTMAQMLTHHVSNGCNLRAGDLMASGTVSGPERGKRGCLLELTWRGTEPVTLPTGEVRRFLEDGDEVILRGYCEREGFRRIGFGECRGVILPALPVAS